MKRTGILFGGKKETNTKDMIINNDSFLIDLKNRYDLINCSALDFDIDRMFLRIKAYTNKITNVDIILALGETESNLSQNQYLSIRHFKQVYSEIIAYLIERSFYVTVKLLDANTKEAEAINKIMLDIAIKYDLNVLNLKVINNNYNLIKQFA